MLVYSSRGWQRFVFTVAMSIFSAGLLFGQASTIPDSMSQTGLGGAHAIVGMVFGPSGQPIAARIRIKLSTMTVGDRITTTDANGNFAFRGLPAGSYTISIDKEKDFEPHTSSVDVFRGTSAQTYTLNITLKLKGGAQAKSEVVNAAFADVPQPALANYNSAIELAKKGDRLASVEQLKLAIKEYPTFMLAYNEMGVQYLRLNQLESADAAFQEALKLNPDAVGALINRGIANVMLKRYGEAVPPLRKAKKIDETSAVCRYFLGQALANLGLFDEAEKELNSAISLGKAEMKEAHRVLAIMYNARGDKKRAAAALEAYLVLAPTTPDAEQLKTAIKQLKESAEATPAQKPSN